MDGTVLGTVVGSVLGFLASVLPVVFDHLRSKQQQNPYLFPTNTTITIDDPEGVVEGAVRPEEIIPVVIPDDTPDDVKLENSYLELLRASVRPVLTYAFFAVFVYVKYLILTHALYQDHTPAIEILPIVWDEGTSALFAAVLAFWFGSRAMVRYSARKK